MPFSGDKKREGDIRNLEEKKVFYGLGFSCVRVYGTNKNNIG